jgi:hypothetical protein
MRFRLVTSLLAAGGVACAPAATGAGRAVPDRSVVGAAELAATGATDLLTALRQVRPEFLLGRGVSSLHDNTPDYPVVYLDGVEIGTIDQLSSITTTNVREVRRLSAQEAMVRTGTNKPGGALLVVTKRSN